MRFSNVVKGTQRQIREMIKALDDEEACPTFQILIFEEIIDPVVPKSSKKYLP